MTSDSSGGSPSCHPLHRPIPSPPRWRLLLSLLLLGFSPACSPGGEGTGAPAGSESSPNSTLILEDASGRTLRFEASPGGGGLRAQVFAFLTESAGRISGEATIPAGGQAAIALSGGARTELPNGKFSFAAGS